MSTPEKVLSTKLLFRGDLYRVSTAFVTLPNGQRTTREFMERPPSVGIAAVDRAKNICIIREYRSAIRKTVLRLPGGRLAEGEPPRHGALRELREETGWKAARLQPLFQFAGGGTWKWLRTYFLATKLSPVPQQLDPDETITLSQVPLKKAVRMALDGEFADADSALAVLKTYELVMRKRLS